MRKRSFFAFILCLVLTFNTIAVCAAYAEDIKYYEAHRTIEINGQTDKAYANKFVTLVLKDENRVINIGETQIDIFGKYQYVFKVSQLPREAELSVKCADENVTSTAYEAILQTRAFIKVNYDTEESQDGYRIIADMTPITEKSESYTAIAAQYNEAGVLTGCKIFESADMENPSDFDKTVAKSGNLKFFVWTDMKEMIPSAYTSEGGGRLILKFGINADKQAREGYNALTGENNYENFNRAKEEISDEFNVIQSIKPEIKRAYYVSQNGDDASAGDINNPFATIERALEEYSGLNDEDKELWTAIYLREGEYNLDDEINIGANKLFIGAYNNEKVILKNTKTVTGDKITKVDSTNTDKETLNRIHSDVENLYYVSYSDLGIENMPGFAYGNGGTKPLLKYNGKRLDISRYPNAGDTYISEVLDSGYDDNMNYTTNVEFIPEDKRPFQWKQSKEIGVSGQLCVTWFYNHTQSEFDYEKGTVKTPSIQTVSQNNRCAVRLVNEPNTRAHFYYYNVFEEIDMPGEWCSDDEGKRIYIYPESKAASDDDKIEIGAETVLNLINIAQSEDVVIDGIEFNTAKKAVDINGGKRVILQNCDFENISKQCVKISKSEYCGVINSEFKQCGYGVNIDGDSENLRNLKAERNFVQNCHFNKMTYTCASIGESCGNIISHNLGENYNASYISIFGGCENIVEYNESASGGLNGNEANIIYIDGQYSSRNNHIRYNYIHDNSPDQSKINLGAGIVMDDMGESNFAYGNILENLGCALSANGGDDNIYDSNIMINCIFKYGASDGMYANEELFGKMISNPESGDRLWAYSGYNLEGTSWSARYTKAVERAAYLKEVSKRWNLGDHTSEGMMFARAATGNYFINNIEVNSKPISIGPEITDFYSYDNPQNGVLSYENNDYSVIYNNVAQDSIDLSEVEYFNRIGLISEPEYDNVSSELEFVYPKENIGVISGSIIETVWKDIDNATSYKIIVSDKDDMSNVLYEKPLIDNRATQQVQTYPLKETTYYYKIEAYNSRAENNPVAQSPIRSVTFEEYNQNNDAEVITTDKSNLASSWLCTEGTQYIRRISSTDNAGQMNDEGEYVRFTADSRNVQHRLVYGKNQYNSVERYDSAYDPNTIIGTTLKVRFPEADKFGEYADIPFFHLSPSKFSDMSYGAHGRAAFFRIESSDGKYILYKGLAVRTNPTEKLGEYTADELFGRWIDVSIDINVKTGMATMAFDGKYTTEMNMDEHSWGDDNYKWNSGNHLRCYDFVLKGNNKNDFVVDIKDAMVNRKISK